MSSLFINFSVCPIQLRMSVNWTLTTAHLLQLVRILDQMAMSVHVMMATLT